MTRRLANGLVLGIVVAIGVAAVASAFLGGGESSERNDTVVQPPADTSGAEERGAETDAEFAGAARALEQNGVVGTLALIDEACEFRALTLPGLLPTTAERPAGCSFPRAPGEPRPAGHPFFQVPAAPGPRCRLRGCAYAWKPEGMATYVRGGEVVELRARCGDRAAPCPHVVLSRGDLAAGFGRASDARVRDLAWLTDERLLAIVRTGRGSSRDVIALFDGRRLLASARVPSTRLSLIRLSPSRRIAAVGSRPQTRIWLVHPRRGGLTVMPFPPWVPPAPTELRAIAWSPDDRWTALATRWAVYVFRTDRVREGYIGIPVTVRDVRLD
jgi:hypothetical protein